MNTTKRQNSSNNQKRRFRAYNATYASCLENCTKELTGAKNADQFINREVIDIEQKNVLYLQPILSLKHTHYVEKMFEDIKNWMEVFYSPIRVQILPTLYEFSLEGMGVANKKNEIGRIQFNANQVLDKVVNPLKNILFDSVGVVVLTDLDLFTNRLDTFCYGFGVPSKGIVQSIQRYLPEYTHQKFDNDIELQSNLQLNAIRIVSHEVAHFLGFQHCLYHNCLMKASNGTTSTDGNPIYFCDSCCRKLKKLQKFDNMERYQNLAKLCEEFGGEFTKKIETQLNVQSFHTHFLLKATSNIDSENLIAITPRISTPRQKNKKLLVIKEDKKTNIDNSFLTTANTTAMNKSKNTNFIIKSSVPTPKNNRKYLIFK